MITLKTLADATPQQVFNQVAKVPTMTHLPAAYHANYHWFATTPATATLTIPYRRPKRALCVVGLHWQGGRSCVCFYDARDCRVCGGISCIGPILFPDDQ